MTKKEAAAIVAKFADGPDRYQNLTEDEIIAYCRFALGGYVTRGKFIYADTQSMAKYVDGELLIKYLDTLKNREGHIAAGKELARIQSCGYLYTYRVAGRDVLCTSEGQTYLKNKYPSN